MTRILAALVLALCLKTAVVASEAPVAVASIKPVHSLLAAVMEGAGAPVLLLDGHASPHTYSLKPSDAAALEKAAIVFRIGPQMEVFLNGPLESLSGSAKVVNLAETPGLLTFGFRPSGVFHDGQHVDQTTDADHDADDDGHHHDDASFDMHFWLDPDNANLMAGQMAAILGEIDPANTGLYRTNAEALRTRLEQLASEIDEILAPVRDARFLVFHDAYRYFENRFHLHGAGSMTLNPQNPPGAETVTNLAAKTAAGGITCAFVEPQFSPKMLDTVAGEGGLRIGTLDPLGASLDAGPRQYEATMRQMAEAFRECLGGA